MKMNQFRKQIPIIVAMVMLLSTVGEAAFGLGTVHVSAMNMLTNKKQLQIHCKSKDNDMGVHVIKANQTYEFKPELSFWGTTDFYCGFVFDEKLHWFDIFVQQRDRGWCAYDEDKCRWHVYDDGPCMYEYTSQKFTNCFPWNKS